MEKRDSRLFQHKADTADNVQGWNVIELESRRDLREQVDELILTALSYTAPTVELQTMLSSILNLYGTRFLTLLVRCLSTKNAEKRQAVVQLLTILNAPETIPLLQELVAAEHHSRSIRLAASLALAGMEATPETSQKLKASRRYAI